MSEFLSRQDGETSLQYHKRIVYGKLVDKTLSDYDYKELAYYLYGKPYASDVARRMFYGERILLDRITDDEVKNITDAQIISELDNKIFELRKEKQKVFDQRRELTKLLSKDGRKEHLYDALMSAADDLTINCGRVYGDEFKPRLVPRADKTDAVLVLTDWHYGMTVSNCFNTYNIEVCKERVMKVVEETIKRVKLHNCGRLHIVVLGDLIHGCIHTGTRVASEELVCNQLMQVSELLAQSIEELSKYVENTFVYVTYGNHARTVQNKNDSIHADNMETIVPWWLSERLKSYEDIDVINSEDEFIFVNSLGHTICASHGDLDSVKGSARLLPLLFNKKYGVDVEYVLLGDKHHRESFSELGVTSIICGSLCGTDDYANDKRLFCKPEQLLLIVTERDGVDAEYHLNCE